MTFAIFTTDGTCPEDSDLFISILTGWHNSFAKREVLASSAAGLDAMMQATLCRMRIFQ